jgi:hypothetical protein
LSNNRTVGEPDPHEEVFVMYCASKERERDGLEETTVPAAGPAAMKGSEPFP